MYGQVRELLFSRGYTQIPGVGFYWDLLDSGPWCLTRHHNTYVVNKKLELPDYRRWKGGLYEVLEEESYITIIEVMVEVLEEHYTHNDI